MDPRDPRLDWRQIAQAQGLQYSPAVPVLGDLYPGLVSWPPQLIPPGPYDFPNPGPLNGEMVYPGHGGPSRNGRNNEDRAGLSPWGRLAKGQPLGKKSVLLFNALDTEPQRATVPILQVEGDDKDAQPLIITLLPPLVIPLNFSPQIFLAGGVQNLTGEQNNLQNTGTFPGEDSSVQWPPFEAIIRWGVGGAQSSASVDFSNGATLGSLTASWVRVHAQVPRNSAVSGTSAAYVLYAFVGPGPGMRGGQYTVWVGTIAAGALSATTPVPRFARRAYVVGTAPGVPPPTTSAVLRLFQDQAGDNPLANYVITGNQPLPFLIPNGSMWADVRNTMDVSANFGIVYELAI